MLDIRSAIAVPPGQFAPFSVVTETDHAAWIIITGSLGLSWTLLFSGIRIFIRPSINRALEYDEYAIAGSTVLAIAQSSIILVACSEGLGKTAEMLSSQVQLKVQRMYYASSILFVLSVGLSKLSVGLLLLRLTSMRLHKMLFNGGLALISVWIIAATFSTALQCNLSRPWITIGERCDHSDLRVKVLGIFDIVTEISLFGMAVFLVWGVKTSARNKALVTGAFVFRLGMIIPIAFRIENFDSVGWTTDPTIREDTFIIWTQTELNYSIISATIPILRPFMNSLNSQFGGMGKGFNGYGYGYGYSKEDSSKDGYKLSSLKAANKRTSRIETQEPRTTAALDPNGHDYNFEIWAPNDESAQGTGSKKVENAQVLKDEHNADATSVDSNDSQRLIIKKDVTFQVRYDTAK